MNVSDVCKGEVVTISGSEMLSAAARVMRERHVGLLVVVQTGMPSSDLMPIGVLTDRDIVTAAIAKDADPRTMRVMDVMSRSPLLASDSQSLAGTLGLMRDAGVRRVPVIGPRGQLTGLLSR